MCALPLIPHFLLIFSPIGAIFCPQDDSKIPHKAHDHQAAKIIALFVSHPVDFLKAPDTVGLTLRKVLFTLDIPMPLFFALFPEILPISIIFFQFSLKY